MYVFGGRNEEQEFNDLKIMKLINPSERQPGKTVMLLQCLKMDEEIKPKHLLIFTCICYSDEGDSV